MRVRITEALIGRADDLAWRMKLRGNDAVHLAAAREWQGRLEEPINARDILTANCGRR